MATFNKIILIGSLIADSELKTTVEGDSLVQFTLSVQRPVRLNESNNKQTDLLKVVVWRELAEKIHPQFKKDALVLVEGSIMNRTYETSAGQKKWVTEIEARDARLLTNPVAQINIPEEKPKAPKIKEKKEEKAPISLEEKDNPIISDTDFDFNNMEDALHNPPSFTGHDEEKIPY